jgi:hypothetical protein
MSRSGRHLVAFSLGIALAGALVAVAGCSLLPGNQVCLEAKAPPRHERVLAEIERLGHHPWAGVYRTRGRWPTELSIAPEAGFTVYDNSWCGNCRGWRGTGRVLASDGACLKLAVECDFELPPDSERPEAWYQLDDTLYLVKWGDLLFAVPSWRIERFCAEASDGFTFPLVPFRNLAASDTFDPVDPTRPDTRPQVPQEFQHLVLDEPVSCRLASLVDSRLVSEQPGTSSFHEAVYSLDAGSRDGLAVGMRLFVEGKRASGRVDHVGLESGRVVVLASLDIGRSPEDLVGSRATTLHPLALRRDR